MWAIDLEGASVSERAGSHRIKTCCTLIPSSASRSRDCCCVSASVRALKPLNMMGSYDLVSELPFRKKKSWIPKGASVRYETTTQSFRSMASSATAFVRSMVRRTEFICRRMGSNGASKSTVSLHQLHNSETHCIIEKTLQPVLSKLRSANASGYLQIGKTTQALAYRSTRKEEKKRQGTRWTSIQLSHGTDDGTSERRGLIGGIGTHFCCLTKRSAKHGIQ